MRTRCRTAKPHLPMRTLVASGLSTGSGAISDIALARRLSSFTASLINEPLRPTTDTPAMTVNNEIHLEQSCVLL